MFCQSPHSWCIVKCVCHIHGLTWNGRKVHVYIFVIARAIQWISIYMQISEYIVFTVAYKISLLVYLCTAHEQSHFISRVWRFSLSGDLWVVTVPETRAPCDKWTRFTTNDKTTETIGQCKSLYETPPRPWSATKSSYRIRIQSMWKRKWVQTGNAMIERMFSEIHTRVIWGMGVGGKLKDLCIFRIVAIYQTHRLTQNTNLGKFSGPWQTERRAFDVPGCRHIWRITP